MFYDSLSSLYWQVNTQFTMHNVLNTVLYINSTGCPLLPIHVSFHTSCFKCTVATKVTGTRLFYQLYTALKNIAQVVFQNVPRNLHVKRIHIIHGESRIK